MPKPAKARIKHSENSFAEPVAITAAETQKLHPATGFFRAPEDFEVLKGVLSKYLKGWDEAIPFRIWVPGCRTGQEAYSVAIAVHEFLDIAKIRPALNILATDVSEAAVQKARDGVFPESVKTEVNERQLRRFFVRTENGYRLAQFVRDSCVFSRHFLTVDPPFEDLDLICCRNVLAYFSAGLQHRVLPILHYALNRNGVLWLGASGSFSLPSNLFVLENASHQFYRKKPNIKQPAPPKVSRPTKSQALLSMNEELHAVNDDLNKRNQELKELVAGLKLAATHETNARQIAERENRTKDEFLAIVSHELRSPLTTILSWAQILRMGRHKRPKLMRGLAVIEKSANAQSQLIDDLLDIARIQAGKMHLNLSTIDPAECVSAAVESIRAVADEKGMALELRVKNCPHKITADPDRLQQVLRNLLTNAVKFTPSGGKITVLLKCTGKKLRRAIEIQVRDTGKGINAEFLPHIFTRFSQADDSTRHHGGLGLGLSIVRHLVEMHGGSVMAESAGQDQGSTFTVTLPIRQK